MRLIPVSVALAIALGSTKVARAQLPDACTVVTLADVTAVLGAGYMRTVLSVPTSSNDVSTCLYTKIPNASVSVSLMAAPNADGKTAVTNRQQLEHVKGNLVAAVRGVCDAAFSIVVSFYQAYVIAGRGAWQIDVLVVMGGRPDTVLAAKLANAACSHFP